MSEEGKQVTSSCPYTLERACKRGLSWLLKATAVIAGSKRVVCTPAEVEGPTSRPKYIRVHLGEAMKHSLPSTFRLVNQKSTV